MKFANTIRTLAAACAFAATAHASAAPILLVDNGILTGANGVDVGGTLYNVTFADGSCNSLFNGCVQSAFAFDTFADASQAAQALLDQVYVDSSAGQFKSITSIIRGCVSESQCSSIIPYSLSETGAYVVWATNNASGSQFVSNWEFDYGAWDSTNSPPIHYAIFQLAPPSADMPEPTSIALFGLAMAGLAFNRRRKV